MTWEPRLGKRFGLVKHCFSFIKPNRNCIHPCQRGSNAGKGKEGGTGKDDKMKKGGCGGERRRCRGCDVV